MNAVVAGEKEAAARLAAALGAEGVECEVVRATGVLADDFRALEAPVATSELVVCAGSEDPALAAAIVAAKAGVPLAIVRDRDEVSDQARAIGRLAQFEAGSSDELARWARATAEGPAADLH